MLQCVSAEPAAMLQHMNTAGVTLFDVIFVSPLCVRMTFQIKHLRQVQTILKNRGERIESIQVHGLFPWVQRFYNRPVLLLVCLFLVLLTCLLPTRILFVTVDGNKNVPTQMVIEKANECGISFGAKRSFVRSEKVKNELLSAIPDLKWVGINTRGCVATISVCEKEPEIFEKKSMQKACSIVAQRNGIILTCTALKGRLLCTVGQAVKEGEVLISGYTEKDFLLTATCAEGEIIAQTVRHLQLLHPVNTARRGAITGKYTRYSLLVGKKLINFYKDSGICDAGCAKIYKQNYLTLPGGFCLPIAVITESWTCFANDAATCCLDDPSWMSVAAEDYLTDHMIGGQIQHSSVSVGASEVVCELTGLYSCTEMIGQVRSEENLLEYGEYNRENR